MKARVYFRVSTKKQDFILQDGAVKKFIRAREIPIDKYYKDFAKSGSNQDRKELQQMLSDAFNKEFNTLIVYKLSRLGRNLREVLEVSHLLKQYGIDLISITEQIDTSTAMGRAYFHLIAVFDELQKDLQNEMISEKLQLLKEQGKKLGRPGLKDHEKKIILEIRKNYPDASIRSIKKIMLEKFNKKVSIGSVHKTLSKNQ